MTSNMFVHMCFEYLFFMIFPIIAIDLVFLLLIIWLGKKRKNLYIAGFAIVIAVQIGLLYRYFFPTYWKYPDVCITSDIVTYADVEEIYGPFDKEGTEPWAYKAYYIYTDRNNDKHYYMINIDTEGFCGNVQDIVLD